MYQVKIPLDMVWMDKNRRVVEMAENVPPCKTAKASECPTYGGERLSMFVLELPAGYARKHGIREGDSSAVLKSHGSHTIKISARTGTLR